MTFEAAAQICTILQEHPDDIVETMADVLVLLIGHLEPDAWYHLVDTIAEMDDRRKRIRNRRAYEDARAAFRRANQRG